MIFNLISSRSVELSILNSNKGKFRRNFSISPILSYQDEDMDEDMYDAANNPENNSDGETEPST